MTTVEAKLEVTRGLFEFAQAFRRQKKRPEIAPAAAEWEIRLKSELEELERMKAATEQPELAMAGHKQEEAA